MIDQDTQLKIQAFLDGELTEAEARDVAALIAANADAAALHTELKNTRRALSGAEGDLKVPETREFYWSRISREIARQPVAEAAPAGPTLWQVLSSWLKPLGAVAAVVIIGVLVWQQYGLPMTADRVVSVQMDSDFITYQNNTTGVTLVWLTDPAQPSPSLN